MIKLVGIIKKLLGYTSENMLNKLREGGADIGKKVIIYDVSTVKIDTGRPWLIKIGSYTKITSGVVILTHDYSLSVLRRAYGEWIGEGAVTEIGENCFIGMNAIILMGTKIGNNVIVGAGSVVRGTIPDNVVVAGNPARIVCTLEEHYENRKKATIEECKSCIRRYYKVKGTIPKPKDLEGFKFLFAPRNKDYIENNGLTFFCNGDEPKEVEEAFYSSKPYWNSFEDMIEEALGELLNKK